MSHFGAAKACRFELHAGGNPHDRKPAVTPATREPAIKPRRIRFSYPVETYRHHYANDDLVLSHAVAFVSAVFPPDEDFFVRSVKQ